METVIVAPVSILELVPTIDVKLGDEGEPPETVLIVSRVLRYGETIEGVGLESFIKLFDDALVTIIPKDALAGTVLNDVGELASSTPLLIMMVGIGNVVGVSVAGELVPVRGVESVTIQLKRLLNWRAPRMFLKRP